MLYFASFILISISIWIGNAALCLFLGIILALCKEIPETFFTQKYGIKILQTGIVFLGGSISVSQITEISKEFLPLVSLYYDVHAVYLRLFVLHKS